MAHLIDPDECINCGACEYVCPVDCIAEDDNVRLITAEDCIDCTACAGTCPVDCISPA